MTARRKASEAAPVDVAAPAVVSIEVDTDPPFLFKVPGSDKVWQLPSLADLPMGIKDAIGKATEPVMAAKKANRKPTPAQLNALGQAQLKLLNSYCPGLADVASERTLAGILAKWGEHSGITMGESAASAG